MNVEQLDFHTLDRVLARLDHQVTDTKVSCLERLGFAGLTVAVYAIPLVLGAVFVARTFDPAIYGKLTQYLESLLGYSVVAAVAFVPLNARLIRKSLSHDKRMQSYETLRLADFLLGRRGRLEESAAAERFVVVGLPAVLTGLLVVSVIAGQWVGGDRSTLGPTAAAIAACLAFFFIQKKTRQLFDQLRRRIDYSREVLTIRRLLEQKRQKAADTNAPVTLNRGLALRLSDLDRMYVLGREAEVRVKAEAPGMTGAPVSWEPRAVADARRLQPGDRLKLEDVIQLVSLSVARHWKELAKDQTALPRRFEAELTAQGLAARREDGVVRIAVPRDDAADLVVSVDPDRASNVLRILAIGGHPAAGPAADQPV